MAAYNYYGQNYGNPYSYPMVYQPVTQQPIQNTTQVPQQNYQQVQGMQNQPSIIWISSENEALSYPVAPNNAVTLWSTTEPVVYLKQADATGKPTLKTYDLVERTPSVYKAPASKDDGGNPYATKEDLVTVASAVKGYDDIIGSLKADIETMKGDLYGVAGRKKPIKKREEEDEE